MTRCAPSTWPAVLLLTVLSACTGTETDNPVVSSEPGEFESQEQWNPGHGGIPPCLSTLDMGKRNHLPLWGRDGNFLIGADAFSGMRVVDVADALHPRVVSEVALAGEPRALLVEPGPAVNLVIDEVAQLNQAEVAEPTALEPVTRLVRFDASNPAAVERVADVDLEGELWRVVQRGTTLWVMSAALVDPVATCDLAPYSCHYVDRKGLILTGYRFAGGAWQRVQRVELPMNAQAWATDEGFASFEARNDDAGNAQGGVLHVVRFTNADLLDADRAVEIAGQQPAAGTPLSFAGDQARFFTQNLTDGSLQLVSYALDSGALLSTVTGFSQQLGPDTRFGTSAVYVGDEGLQQGAVLVDLSDPSAPLVTDLPAPVSIAFPLDDTGTRLLGVGTEPDGIGTRFVLLQVQGGAVSVLDQLTLDARLAQPASDSLTLQNGRLVFRYYGADRSTQIGALVASDSALTLLGPVGARYPNEIVVAGDVVYAPDSYGLSVGSFAATGSGGGTEGTRLDWNGEVFAYIAVGEYEAALLQPLDGPRTLELTRGAEVHSFEVGPGATRLIGDDEHVLVLSYASQLECEQSGSGLDCTGYEPHVASYTLSATPKLAATVALPDADLFVQRDDLQVSLDWSVIEQAPFALGAGRFVFAVDLHGQCTTAAGCDALGVDGVPIAEANVNVSLPGAPAPCPPGMPTCEQPPAPAAPTVFGQKYAERFYVLDVSVAKPRFSKAVESVLELDDSRFGPPRVSDGTVLATRLERAAKRPTPGVPSDGSPATARFMLDRFELGDDGALHAQPAISVPGYALALAADGAILITAEPDPAERGATIVHRLAIDDRGAVDLQSLDLPARHAQVAAALGKVFYLHQNGEGCEGTTTVVPIALPTDAKNELRKLPSIELPGATWSLLDARDGRLLLADGRHGYAVLQDRDDAAPKVLRFVSVAGYLDRPQLLDHAIIGAGSLWGKQQLTF